MPIFNDICYNNLNQISGPMNCYVKIKGETRKIGQLISGVKVVLYDQGGYPQMYKKSDDNGHYYFAGCAKGVNYTIIAFDPKRKFNAVIQDNVVPK